MSANLLRIIFYWILPLSIALASFFMFLKFTHLSFEKTDVDRVWGVVIKIGIVLGAFAIVYVIIANIPGLSDAVAKARILLHNLLQNEFISKFKNDSLAWWQRALLFIAHWLPIYLRAFIFVWIPACAIWIQGLIWRIKFSRSANIIVRTIALYPYLCFKYLLGYQTPFFDYVQSKLYIAKIKENINDSYFDALQGRDENGQPFDKGQGGTVRTQSIKSATLAIRQTHAQIKTANGVRHAQLTVRHSRETTTDQVIKQQLDGLGLRLSAPSIRFQEDPLLNPDKGGYIFDSDVQYNAGDQLGSWQAIFSNPFAKDIKISNGGNGAINAINTMVKGVFFYIFHLTPSAVFEKIRSLAKLKYTPDLTSERAKYKAQQNLDLDVVPEPVDQETGATIDMLKERARKVANDRVSEVTDALTRYKINASFDQVEVGGNTAVYQYTLSRSSNIPNDFSRIQEGLANLLRTTDVPIIRTTKGQLLVTMVNGVNIPIDFKAMIEKRPKGIPEIMSGIAGEDAMGNLIDFILGDKVPHAMLFGKTGTGKTVLLMNIIYSMMSATDPTHLKVAFVDGKGNSFEFMRSDNSDGVAYHPNPYVYAQPADGSGDIDYARALVQHMVKETRHRIDLFKQKGVSKLAEYNRKYPDKFLPEILLVVDEFSALTDSDNLLKASELAERGMTDAFEYLAKMGRSAGIRMLLANQTARKLKVPGRITANIAGRISLGVTEPIESDIALPDSKVAVHLIQQPGEFYSAMHGARNVQHGNTPFLSDDVMYALNDSLETKFGHEDYKYNRESILDEMAKGTDLTSGKGGLNYPIPENIPTIETSLDNIVELIDKYPEWAIANKGSDIFQKNEELHQGTPKQCKVKQEKINDAFNRATDLIKTTEFSKNAITRGVSGDMMSKVTSGSDQGVL